MVVVNETIGVGCRKVTRLVSCAAMMVACAIGRVTHLKRYFNSNDDYR